MESWLKPEQLAKLEEKLDVNRVAVKKVSGRTLSYLEGYDVIAKANEIFGYDGWGYTPLANPTTEAVGQNWISRAIVKVWIYVTDPKTGERTVVERTDIGRNVVGVKAGTELNGDAVDTSEKGAVTDALKRAFRTFGDQFGNSLYDKDDPVSTAAQTGANAVNPNPPPAPTPVAQAKPQTPAAPVNQQSTPVPAKTQTKTCQTGGSPMFHKSGMKDGKAWSGFFCSNPDSKTLGCKALWDR